MRLRSLLLVSTCLAVVAAAGVSLCVWSAYGTKDAVGTLSGPPNIILISMDTTRADHLSCYNYGRKTTPNIDQLAARGVRFANVYTQAPWTLPSHMALFTSLLPSHNGVDGLRCVLASEIPTLAEILSRNGYNTAALVNDSQMKAAWGFNRGFQQWSEFDNKLPAGDCVHITDEAVAWLERHPAEPFFLYLHYYDPHNPYDPPASFREAFGSTISGQEATRIIRREQPANGPASDPELLAQAMASYDGEIAWVDHELSRLFDKLPPNTIVVLFADHGEAFMEHGVTLHGDTLYEEVAHVPLIVSGAGVPSGQVVLDPAMLLDVAPTILSLCGIAPPAHYEGTDLSPAWHGEHLPERFILAETKWTLDNRVVKMAMLGEWKYIGSMYDGKRELYQLPDEKTERSSSEPKMAKVLGEVVDHWLTQEEVWIIYAHGEGNFALKAASQRTDLLYHLPGNAALSEKECDTIDKDDDYVLTWKTRPAGKTRKLILQQAPLDMSLHLFDFRIDGVKSDRIFVGPKNVNAATLPGEELRRLADAGPYPGEPVNPSAPGFYIRLYRPPGEGHFSWPGTGPHKSLTPVGAGR